MDVPSLMRQAKDLHAERTALIVGGRRFTFEEAWSRGCRVANAMIALGVRPGDRVAAVEDNNLGAADFFLGSAIAGAVRVPLYARNSREAHRAMIARTKVKLVFADPQYADSIGGLDAEVGCLDHVVVRGTDYEDWLARHSATDPAIKVADDDWYIIRHSSGTTGRSKGVGYTQNGWLVNSRNWFYRLPRLSPESVLGHAAPISHASGYMLIPVWLHGGANLLFGPFEPRRVLEEMAAYGMTHVFLAPSMVAALAAEPGAGSRDWSRLGCILTGGAPITDATIAASRRVFGDTLYQVFGSTEATPLTIATPQEWFGAGADPARLRSAGRLMPFAQAEIRDAEGAVVPFGEEGEIFVRCEAQMQGYWEDPELSANRLIDGWVRTGDIGRLDRDGFLYILDRADDMIVSGGLNIWPSELETVIADHPAIIEVAVFGIPHAQWGETPMAVCRTAGSAAVSMEDVVRIVTDRMGSYMKPTRVEFTTEPLPKTVVGKLNRRALRDPFWVGHERHVGGS